MNTPEQEQQKRAYNKIFSLEPLAEHEFTYRDQVLTFRALGEFRGKLTYFILLNDEMHYVEFFPEYHLVEWYNFIHDFMTEGFRRQLLVNNQIPPMDKRG